MEKSDKITYIIIKILMYALIISFMYIALMTKGKIGELSSENTELKIALAIFAVTMVLGILITMILLNQHSMERKLDELIEKNET